MVPLSGPPMVTFTTSLPPSLHKVRLPRSIRFYRTRLLSPKVGKKQSKFPKILGTVFDTIRVSRDVRQLQSLDPFVFPGSVVSGLDSFSPTNLWSTEENSKNDKMEGRVRDG